MNSGTDPSDSPVRSAPLKQQDSLPMQLILLSNRWTLKRSSAHASSVYPSRCILLCGWGFISLIISVNSSKGHPIKYACTGFTQRSTPIICFHTVLIFASVAQRQRNSSSWCNPLRKKNSLRHRKPIFTLRNYRRWKPMPNLRTKAKSELLVIRRRHTGAS